MKKRGFTLIELLAVIVILAIIALIAVPAVLNIIEDSRKGAAEASARNIVSAAKTYYMQSTMNGETVDSVDLSKNELKYDGEQAIKGNITFTNGKPSGKLYVSGYCVEIKIDGTVTSEKMDENECEIIIEPIVYTKYADGTPLLFNPNENRKCSDSEVETNVNNYKSSNSDYDGNPRITGLKDGCMKWYAFLDSEESSTVKLLLDHNTSALVEWAYDYDQTPILANARLESNVTNWNDTVKATARLISAEEVNMIAPTTGDFIWSSTDTSTSYFFHNGNSERYKGAKGTNKYAWLFDNMTYSENYGANVTDGGTTGYWTSTFSNTPYSRNSWAVGYFGWLTIYTVSDNGIAGIRPVIEVSKDIFE